MIGSLRFAVMPGGEDFEIHVSAANRVDLVECFSRWVETWTGMNRALAGARVNFGCHGTCLAHFQIVWFSRRRFRVTMDEAFKEHLVDWLRVMRYLIQNPDLLLNDGATADLHFPHPDSHPEANAQEGM